ncbi:MAG: hypothetical protein LBC18_15025 [Opitutaceae bacterium]|jgi:hypothetical protein|nr:hypothetical protein [Opitutaceae bacterium]
MAERETIKVIAGIIQRELALPAGRVVIYNQRIPIPPDAALFIAVGLAGKTVIGNNARHHVDPADPGTLRQEQTLHIAETITINAFSAGPEARERNHEIVMALRSDYAQQQCEKHSLHIGRVPVAFNDVSEVENTARLNRYAITIQTTRMHVKDTATDSFDQFQPPLIVAGSE